MDGDCTSCRRDVVLDLRKRDTRDFLRDIESRHQEKIRGRVRALSTVVAMAVMVGLWLIPGFWVFRSRTFALPMFVDQWLLTIAIAVGLTNLLEAAVSKRRLYPFLDDE